MKGKRPTRLNKIRAKLLADEATRAEYVNQRMISELGGIVARVLREQKLTQTSLARAAQMHQPDLSALLRGRAAHVPTLGTLRRLAQGLGVGLAIHIEPNGAVSIQPTEDSPKESEVLAHDNRLDLAR
jgi:transcriptional regulator with XRE-family HTH domain